MTIDLSLIRILTADDHPLLRKGIAALVNTEPDMKLIAEASNGPGELAADPVSREPHELRRRMRAGKRTDTSSSETRERRFGWPGATRTMVVLIANSLRAASASSFVLNGRL